jgi:hypothetical protein
VKGRVSYLLPCVEGVEECILESLVHPLRGVRPFRLRHPCSKAARVPAVARSFSGETFFLIDGAFPDYTFEGAIPHAPNHQIILLGLNAGDQGSSCQP